MQTFSITLGTAAFAAFCLLAIGFVFGWLAGCYFAHKRFEEDET